MESSYIRDQRRRWRLWLRATSKKVMIRRCLDRICDLISALSHWCRFHHDVRVGEYPSYRRLDISPWWRPSSQSSLHNLLSFYQNFQFGLYRHFEYLWPSARLPKGHGRARRGVLRGRWKENQSLRGWDLPFRDKRSIRSFQVSPKSKELIKCVLFLTGTKTRFKHMKIKYPFHARFWIKVGVIMTTKKFHNQFAEMPIACLEYC